MRERIQQFIDHKRLSPGDLAVKIEVQRSNISHILNGRNKPGAVFIEKFLLAFPDINARWLLTGEGEMLQQNNTDTDIPVPQEVKSEPEAVYGERIIKKPEVKNTSVKNTSEKEITGIIILQSDGTFKNFNPE